MSHSVTQKAYNWMLVQSQKAHAVWVLALVSFAESSFSPLPPDLLLIPMMLSRRDQVWKLAGICTLSSVIGGIVGYALGYALYDSLGSWIIHTYNLQESFLKFQYDFQTWGFWIIVLKGLTPIPYKLVTVGSGFIHLDVKTFVIASIIARGFRFYLLGVLFWYCGDWAKQFIEKYLWLALTATLGIVVLGFLIVKWFF